MDLPEAVIDEIFERALRLQQRVYSAEYIKFLLRYKKLMSVFELFDLTGCKASAIRFELLFYQSHQEVETEDINHCHGKNGCIREVDYRTQICRCPNHNENTEDNFKS